MILRLEVFGRVLHLELSRLDPEPEETPPPEGTAYPMTVEAVEGDDPIASRLGFEGKGGRRGN